VSEPDRERERGEIRDLMRTGCISHVEAVDEIELNHASVGNPRPAEVRRAIQQRLRLKWPYDSQQHKS
jgi:hypothetical protein